VNDDDLRDRLRHADPATTLAGLGPNEVTALVAAATGAATAPSRRRWPLLVAAALLPVAAGVGWLATGGLQPTGPTAGPGASASGTATPGPVVTLTAPGPMAKCRPPDAATLAGSADFAFAGTLDSVSGKTATFTVTEVFHGPATARVQVEVDDTRSETLLGPGTLTVGTGYLIAAADGSVLPCGYSGTADAPGLRALFDEAF
jgi:hypothetical protein